MHRKKTLKQLALTSVLIAVGVGLGYILAGIPNIELITLTIFIAGYALGTFRGILSGLAIWIIYGIFNPFGMAPFPITAAQILSGIIIGFSGGMVRIVISKYRLKRFKIVLFALSGIILALVFQILLNLSALLVYSSEETILAYLMSGLAFALLHIIFNGMIFTIIMPAIDGLIKSLSPTSGNF